MEMNAARALLDTIARQEDHLAAVGAVSGFPGVPAVSVLSHLGA